MVEFTTGVDADYGDQRQRRRDGMPDIQEMDFKSFGHTYKTKKSENVFRVGGGNINTFINFKSSPKFLDMKNFWKELDSDVIPIQETN